MRNAPESSHVLILADVHVRRYRHQLERAMAGDRGYRADESKTLLDIWLSVQQKGGAWRDLAPNERVEVEDAIEDEE